MSDSRRKVLKESVCLLLSEVGFTSASDDSLETLVEMLQSCMLRKISGNILFNLFFFLF